MDQNAEVFIGLGVAKARLAVAKAGGGRRGEVRHLGEIGADRDSVCRLVSKLEKRHRHALHFCYEAGPIGYGSRRQLVEFGCECVVVAPPLIQRIRIQSPWTKPQGKPCTWIGLSPRGSHPHHWRPVPIED